MSDQDQDDQAFNAVEWCFRQLEFYVPMAVLPTGIALIVHEQGWLGFWWALAGSVFLQVFMFEVVLPRAGIVGDREPDGHPEDDPEDEHEVLTELAPNVHLMRPIERACEQAYGMMVEEQVNEMVRGLVRAAEILERNDTERAHEFAVGDIASSGRPPVGIWDDDSRKALATARMYGWGRSRTGHMDAARAAADALAEVPCPCTHEHTTVGSGPQAQLVTTCRGCGVILSERD